MPPLVGMKLVRHEDIGARHHNRISRAVLHAIAQEHLALHVKRHFEDNPSTRPGGPYGYRKRSAKWNAFKQRVFGHQIPNVATGAAMISVLGSSRITATKDRSRLYLKPGHPIHAYQRAELEAMTPGELRSHINRANRLYADEVRQVLRKPARAETI